MLVNILANAVKYTDHGDIVLALGRSGADADACVLFEITDTGRGIASEDHEHIFDAFWQEDETLSHNTGSTGLGLSVARQLARLLGGDVRLERSALSHGSTFVVQVPVTYVSPPGAGAR